jgi:hypothetical protein
VIKKMGAQDGRFLVGCKCPVSRGIVVREQEQRGKISEAFFLRNILQMHQEISAILGVDGLALWKLIN